ncbi:MAG: rhodanese-like domain-containing protein [Caldilineaceae bacterium]
MIDVRDEANYNVFHLVGATSAPLETVPEIIPALLTEPANTLFVVMSNDETLATEAWRTLVAESVPNAYIPAGGINNWLDTFGDDGVQAAVFNATGDETLRHPFTGGRVRAPGGQPDPHAVHVEYVPKVEMKLKPRAQRRRVRVDAQILRDVLATLHRYAVGVIEKSRPNQRNGGRLMNPLSNHQAGMAQHHEYETLTVARGTPPQAEGDATVWNRHFDPGASSVCISAAQSYRAESNRSEHVQDAEAEHPQRVLGFLRQSGRRMIQGCQTSHTLPTRAGPGVSVTSPGSQPDGVTSPVARMRGTP